MDALCRRLADDLDGTFPDFVRSHQDAVFTLALRLTYRRADAEDIAQDTFVRAYRALRAYPAERVRELRAGAWLASITLNLVRNLARSMSRRPSTGPLTVDPPADDSTDRYAETRLWEERLAALPTVQASAVVLRHVLGFGYADVAAALDVPVGTAKAHVHRGLAALRTMIEREEQTW